MNSSYTQIANQAGNKSGIKRKWIIEIDIDIVD